MYNETAKEQLPILKIVGGVIWTNIPVHCMPAEQLQIYIMSRSLENCLISSQQNFDTNMQY